MASCRILDARQCPSQWSAGCGDRPCARFESDDETPWIQEPQAREVGPVEKAVEDDLAALAERIRPGKFALAALARKLARVIDARGDEEPASQTAKAVDTLRITLNQIMTGEDANSHDRELLAELLSTPSSGGAPVSAEVRYPKDP